MNKRYLSALILFFCFMFTFLSCTSHTVINSKPQGAEVYINDEYYGVTPYTYSDTKMSWTVNKLVLKKDGYEDFQTTFKKDEELNIAACCGGILVLVPFLWLFDYKEERTYILDPAGVPEWRRGALSFDFSEDKINISEPGN